MVETIPQGVSTDEGKISGEKRNSAQKMNKGRVGTMTLETNLG